MVDLETRGLEPAECANVKRALSKIANHAAAIPDGSFWHGSISNEFETFLSLYAQWNSHDGRPDAAAFLRQDTLRELRLARNRIATKIRKNQFILQNELDLALVEGMYTALRELVTTLPSIFRTLAVSVARYDDRKLSPG